MHEFSSVREALSLMLSINPKPPGVRITLGRMRANPKTFREMLMEHLRGTEAEGMAIEIVSVPVEVSCACGFSGTVRLPDHVHFARCPLCGKVADITKGNELVVEPVATER